MCIRDSHLLLLGPVDLVCLLRRLDPLGPVDLVFLVRRLDPLDLVVPLDLVDHPLGQLVPEDLVGLVYLLHRLDPLGLVDLVRLLDLADLLGLALLVYYLRFDNLKH